MDTGPYPPSAARLAVAIAGAIVDGIDEREGGAKTSFPGRRAARLFCEMKWAAVVVWMGLASDASPSEAHFKAEVNWFAVPFFFLR